MKGDCHLHSANERNLRLKENLMMKKYTVLLAILTLVLASFACQTVMGGGKNLQAPDVPDMPNVTDVPQTDGGEIPTVPPVTTDGGGVTVGGESPFPVTSDAFNTVSTPQSVTYQTKMSADEVMNFYRDELGKQGFTENKDMTTSFGGIVAMFFEGGGKTIVLAGAPAGDGSLSVTLAYQQ
jgi:predicted small secreted protein